MGHGCCCPRQRALSGGPGGRRARWTPALSAPQTRAECSPGGRQKSGRQAARQGPREELGDDTPQLCSLCAPNPGSPEASFEGAESGRKGTDGVSSAPNQRDPETPAAPGTAATQLHITPSTSSNTSTRDLGSTRAQLPSRKGGVLRAPGEVGVGEKRSGAPRGFLPPRPWAWARTTLPLGPHALRLSGGWWSQSGPCPRGAPPELWGGSDQDTGVTAAP